MGSDLAAFAATPKSGSQLDSESLRILTYFQPSALKRPETVNIRQIVENLEDWPYEPVQLGVSTLPAGTEAYTDPDRRLIMVDEHRVYRAAIAGDGRARQTLAHEVGHLQHIQQVAHIIQHATGPALQRSINVPVPTFRDPEWQANHLGSALLMPATMASAVYRKGGVAALTETFGVTEANARSRVRALEKLRVL